MEAKKRILVVDDDETPRKMATMALSSEYSVIAVASAREALDLLAEQPFDLLVTDCEMPMMTGVDLVREVRRQYGALPCLMVSGGGMDENRRAWLAANDVTYLPKPYRLHRLLALVADLLRR